MAHSIPEPLVEVILQDGLFSESKTPTETIAVIPTNLETESVITDDNKVRVFWDDGHQSEYLMSWLEKYSGKNDNARNDQTRDLVTYSHWGAEVKNNPPVIHFDAIMAGNEGLGKWTSKIREFGFCFVDGCPVSPEKTQELLERIAFIRVTHYGKHIWKKVVDLLTCRGGFYDFTSDLTMKDTAYTSLALQAHTDTTYFTDPAGLQMFHLLSHTDGHGGASLLVDGFNAAEILRKEDPTAFEILTKVPIQWHASGNDGITITPERPMPVISIQGEFGLDDVETANISQIRWNNDDRAVVPLGDGGSTALAWYDAASKWTEILKRQNMEYWEQLVPGRALIFDNWRVLHGRSAFTGKRRICGGYINRDDFISRWRNTNFSRKEVLEQIL
ncbi:trimethyllysine dioxygenase [Coleophoma crateriformis]|uniref:Trimethyllysine dioxygenase n=1 Tax=Coleophoma crateriformis TaxID=565419 RepID=A0A3D8QEG9_9HELO|nr:trimethyllysine dioxygenase [Coleophoma crateriformis]